MDEQTVLLIMLDRAFDALCSASSALTLAAKLPETPEAVAREAEVLANATDLEAQAVHAVIRRC